VWVQDHDADLNTNADRRVAYAMWDGQAWSAPVEPATWPTGALYPSVAFDSADRPIVVFTSRGTLESGEEAGVGNYDSLWSAYRKGDWVVQPVGVDTAAEWPRVLVNAEDQAIVVFRQFGEAGTVHFTGEVAAAVADLTQPTLQWGPPDLLTEEGGPNWQIAFDIDPNTGTTEVLYIKGAPASASSQLQALGNDGDQLYGLSLPFAPDLRIRPADIAFSNEHPIAGETIKITATVRNKGFQAVDAPVTVRFFRGDPDAGGTLIGQGTTGPAMAFGESSEVAITWAALGGRQDVYVLVDPNQQTADFQRDNNKAFRTVGTMPAPGGLVAATYPASNSILLSWTAPDTGGIAGYYVYRSTTSGSGYSLIANVSTTSYEDAGLPDDVVYYYVVVAYDAYGVRSEHSNEASASLPGIYTPTPTNTPTVTPTPTHTPTRTASPTRTPGRILLPVILKG
ncbi:MAG: hypothetical protein FJ026_16130, partial [Chloroflexi bacterium]|nr:hypothetical protein [Chloroflexota bacterium]